MTTSNLAIRANGLGKQYRIASAPRSSTLREAMTSGLSAALRRATRPASRREGEREFWALRDISFDVREGESVGLIGPNGSGKSTLLKIISRIVAPTTGEARIRGRVGALLEVGTGFHPELTGRDNIFLNGAIIGMSAEDIRKRFDEIVEFSGVGAFLGVPIKRYSSGMVMRLAFAVAAHLEPDVLIIDEVLAVGDAEFQRKCLGRMDEVAKGGCTVFFVSHNLDAVQRLCSRAILLGEGRMIADGIPVDVIGQYVANSSQRIAPDEWMELPARGKSSIEPAITGVRYGDPGRPSLSAPRSLGPLRIEVRIEAPMALNAMLAADIKDGLGNKLINADPWAKGNQQISLPAGVSIWRFDFESLYLEAGRYVIDFWLADLMGSTLDYRPMAVEMDVLNAKELPADPSLPPQYYGLVACPFALSRQEMVE